MSNDEMRSFLKNYQFLKMSFFQLGTNIFQIIWSFLSGKEGDSVFFENLLQYESYYLEKAKL